MSDIIEFALSTITDYIGFEDLATSVMQEEGFHDIKPLGGVGDYSQDATVEKLYENAREKYVFQYTVDKKTALKLTKTIKDLKKNDIDFHTLVYVTSISVSSSLQTDLIKEVRKEYGKTLLFYERKTFLSVLRNSSNNIYIRHFSDMEKQLASYSARADDLSLDEKNILEAELLKVNLAFVHNEDAQGLRKKFFEHLVLAVINDAYPKRLTTKEIQESLHALIPGKEYLKDRLTNSLLKLEKRGEIDSSKGSYATTEKAHSGIELDTLDSLEKLSTLTSDIVALAIKNHPEPLDDDTLRRSDRNVRRALMAYFRAFGTEISSQYSSEVKSFPVFQRVVPSILDECKRQIGDKLGELLFDSIGQLLASPNEEHIEALHYLVLAHVTNAIMVLDPSLKEFQATKFSEKTFILDTDFLINCIVPDVAEYNLCTQLITDLLALRATVVIPDSSIDECILHAKFSVNTYNYFNSNLLSLPEAVAKEKIYNAFVRDYYFSIKKGKLHPSVNYASYLRNYYDHEKPVAFMKEVIKAHIPEGVVFKNVTDIYQGEVDDKEYDNVFKEMLALIEGTKKAKYRDHEENKMYAEVDTALFLATLNCNNENVKDTILGGSHYLLTDSGRYRIISSKLDYKDTVSTRPQALMSILASIGSSSISKADLMNTLENPLLMHTMEKRWDEIGKLIKLGFDLSHMSLPRLQMTMETKLHELLTKIDLNKYTADTDEFRELLTVAEELGFVLPPTGKALEAKIKAKDQTIKELEETIAAKKNLEDEILKFGKRRQKYLRRMANAKK